MLVGTKDVTVLTGRSLAEWASDVRNFRKRDIYAEIVRFLFDTESARVLALCGLKQTGKTVLLKQAVLELISAGRTDAAVVEVQKDHDALTLMKILEQLHEAEYKYVFLNEVTASPDFLDMSASIADTAASFGMKIVLSGTDSLSFILASKSELYGRCVVLNTTRISYREFERVLGVTGVDKYIECGGTMCVEGTPYEKDSKSAFSLAEETAKYIDTAIAENIQRSLDHWKDGDKFGALRDLRANNGFANAVNRIIEDMNHLITLNAITQKYESRDPEQSAGIAAKNASFPRGEEPVRIDRGVISDALKRILSIKNLEEQKIGITDRHTAEIQKILGTLGLLHKCHVYSRDRYGSWTEYDENIIVQPGMRYSQAKSLVEILAHILESPGAEQKDIEYVASRILSVVEGRLLKDIVLDETTASLVNAEDPPGERWRVARFRFVDGEVNMAVYDPFTQSTSIFEVKHSSEIACEQAKHLLDTSFCQAIASKYSKIDRRFVLYEGETKLCYGVCYLNVEDYLRNVGDPSYFREEYDRALAASLAQDCD